MNNFVTELLERIDTIGDGFSERAYGAVSAEILPLLHIALIIYVMIYGIQLLMGTAQISVREFVGRTARMMLILAFTSHWDVFAFLIYDWLSRTPEAVGRAILATVGGKVPSEPTDGLSMIVRTAFRAGDDLAKQAGYFTFLPSILGFLIMALGVIFAGIALAMLVLSKVMMWVLVGTGPIFISCLLFEQTRTYGTSWFSQVLLYGIIPLFVFVIAAFMIAAINPELAKIDGLVGVNTGKLQLEHLLSFILLTLAGIFVLLNVQSLAQSIVGGIAGNVGAFGVAAGLAPHKAAWNLGKKGVGAVVGRFNNRASKQPPPPGGGSIKNRSSAETAMQQRISDMSRPT